MSLSQRKVPTELMLGYQFLVKGEAAATYLIEAHTCFTNFSNDFISLVADIEQMNALRVEIGLRIEEIAQITYSSKSSEEKKALIFPQIKFLRDRLKDIDESQRNDESIAFLISDLEDAKEYLYCVEDELAKKEEFTNLKKTYTEFKAKHQENYELFLKAFSTFKSISTIFNVANKLAKINENLSLPEIDSAINTATPILLEFIFQAITAIQRFDASASLPYSEIIFIAKAVDKVQAGITNITKYDLTVENIAAIVAEEEQLRLLLKEIEDKLMGGKIQDDLNMLLLDLYAIKQVIEEGKVNLSKLDNNKRKNYKNIFSCYETIYTDNFKFYNQVVNRFKLIYKAIDYCNQNLANLDEVIAELQGKEDQPKKSVLPKRKKAFSRTSIMGYFGPASPPPANSAASAQKPNSPGPGA